MTPVQTSVKGASGPSGSRRRPGRNQASTCPARANAWSSAAIVAARSSLVSPRQARTVQSQTASNPFARSIPAGPVAGAPAASSNQAMLRKCAPASINAVGGSAGNARNNASTPARCVCNTSTRRITRSNSRSRTPVSTAISPARACRSAIRPNFIRTAVRPENRARARSNGNPASPAATATLIRDHPTAAALANAAVINALSNASSSMPRT